MDELSPPWCQESWLVAGETCPVDASKSSVPLVGGGPGSEGDCGKDSESSTSCAEPRCALVKRLLHDDDGELTHLRRRHHGGVERGQADYAEPNRLNDVGFGHPRWLNREFLFSVRDVVLVLLYCATEGRNISWRGLT